MTKPSFSLISATLIFCLMSTSTLAVKHVINVENFAFVPANILSVTVGDTIRWVWIEGFHTTTSTNLPAGASSWDETISSNDLFFEYKVTVPGVYNYLCTPHSSVQLGSFTATSPAVILEVSPLSRNVTAVAGFITFDVVSNADWHISSADTWVTYTVSGSGNGTLQVDFGENNSSSTRTATITVTSGNNITRTITILQEGTVSVRENTLAGIKIFPNPSNGVIAISSEKSILKNSRIQVIDLKGNIMLEGVLTNPTTNLDTSSLARGTYLIKIEQDNKSHVSKVVLMN